MNFHQEQRPVEAIKSVVRTAYVEGVHETQDVEVIKGGFHDDFRMLVYGDDRITKVSVEEWLPRIERLKADNPGMWSSKTNCVIEFVDVSGNAAAVKLKVYKGDVHFSDDYMLLYRFPEGWKIVSKIFSVPEG